VNWVDSILLGVIALSILVGLARGLVREVLSLAMWACALLVAWFQYPRLQPLLAEWIASESIRMAAAFLIIVLLVLVVGTLIGHLVARLVERGGLTGTDRLLGGLFGAVRGGLLIAMAVFLAALTPLPEDVWWEGSALIGRFQVLAEQVLGEVPPEVVERVKKL
jgi:membrane protein required for colicin V production